MDPFAAIADPVRRSLLEQLAQSGATRVVDLTEGRGISRPAVSRHLRLLGEAGLVHAVERGRERHYELVPGPLEQVSAWVGTVCDRLVPPVSEHQLDALDLEVRRTVRDRAQDQAQDQTADRVERSDEHAVRHTGTSGEQGRTGRTRPRTGESA